MQAKIETLKAKNSADEEYLVYPRTLIKCITNENGDNLEDTLQEYVDTKFQDTYATKTELTDVATSANEYTDTAISNLVNGAPETLDTLKEISDALAENEDVVEAINAAITNKADASDLTTHTSDATIHHSHSNKSVLDSTTASYTTEEQTKLSGIAAGANAYTHPNSGVTAGTYRSVTVNAAGHVTDGSNPTLPVSAGGTGATDAATARSNLGITPANIGAAASSHGTHVSYGTSASALGTSSAGSATTVSRSDHVHALPALTSCTGTLTVAKGGTGNTSVDTTPTSGSTKMVTSGGVYTALAGKLSTSGGTIAGNLTFKSASDGTPAMIDGLYQLNVSGTIIYQGLTSYPVRITTSEPNTGLWVVPSS